MKSIWMLAAVASLTACAGRGEDDMGAAPDRGDTTAVTTGADTTQWDTTNTGGVGQTAEPGMVPDTSAANEQADTTEQYPTTPGTTTDTVGQSGSYPTDTTSAGQSSNPTGGYDSTVVPGADSSTSVPSADPGMSSDSAAVEHNVPDSAATPQ